jgi:hypothetical protein
MTPATPKRGSLCLTGSEGRYLEIKSDASRRCCRRVAGTGNDAQRSVPCRQPSVESQSNGRTEAE